MEAAIKIGNTIEKESLIPMADAIIKIMEARADQETIRAGLEALGRLTEIKSLTIKNCNINTGSSGGGHEFRDSGLWSDDPDEELDE